MNGMRSCRLHSMTLLHLMQASTWLHVTAATFFAGMLPPPVKLRRLTDDKRWITNEGCAETCWSVYGLCAVRNFGALAAVTGATLSTTSLLHCAAERSHDAQHSSSIFSEDRQNVSLLACGDIIGTMTVNSWLDLSRRDFMKRLWLTLVLLALVTISLGTSITRIPPIPQIRLVLLIADDQFRYDYLTRFHSEYLGGLTTVAVTGSGVHQREPRALSDGHGRRSRNDADRCDAVRERHHRQRLVRSCLRGCCHQRLRSGRHISRIQHGLAGIASTSAGKHGRRRAEAGVAGGAGFSVEAPRLRCVVEGLIRDSASGPWS